MIFLLWKNPTKRKRNNEEIEDTIETNIHDTENVEEQQNKYNEQIEIFDKNILNESITQNNVTKKTNRIDNRVRDRKAYMKSYRENKRNEIKQLIWERNEKKEREVKWSSLSEIWKQNPRNNKK